MAEDSVGNEQGRTVVARPVSYCKQRGCGRRHFGHGMCKLHYDRWRKYGDVNKVQFHVAGQTKHPLYKTYMGMIARCTIPSATHYEYYGGKGVKVCERWSGLDGFSHFVEDMGEKPSATHSVDRINSNGDYSPDNCRWASKTEQTLNQGMRANNTSGYVGVHWHKILKKWRASITINYKRIVIGDYTDKIVAAEAYIKAARELRGAQ